jgi:hypothetical protein
MASLWAPSLKDDPLKFVLYLFPWGQPGTPLEHFQGPRKWQREVLRELADHIKANGGKVDYDVFRMAVSSGRGIGKSALVSWLVIWMLTTRIGSSTIVSANSETQLRSITWAEITKWLALALNSHWFEVSATRVMPAKWLAELVERDLKKGTRYWGVEGRLWSEENPDAYAGVHNFDGVLLVFDEASGIADAIWQVAAGFFTENTPNRFWMAFSNPRRNTGYFGISGATRPSTPARSKEPTRQSMSRSSRSTGLTAFRRMLKSTASFPRLEMTSSSRSISSTTPWADPAIRTPRLRLSSAWTRHASVPTLQLSRYGRAETSWQSGATAVTTPWKS